MKTSTLLILLLSVLCVGLAPSVTAIKICGPDTCAGGDYGVDFYCETFNTNTCV